MPARGGHIIEPVRPAKADRHAFRRVFEGDAHDVDLLQILLQRGGKGQVPVGGRDHDGFRFRKLPREIKERVLKLSFGEKPVAPCEEGLVDGGEGDVLQTEFFIGSAQPEEQFFRQLPGSGLFTNACVHIQDGLFHRAPLHHARDHASFLWVMRD